MKQRQTRVEPSLDSAHSLLVPDPLWSFPTFLLSRDLQNFQGTGDGGCGKGELGGAGRKLLLHPHPEGTPGTPGRCREAGKPHHTSPTNFWCSEGKMREALPSIQTPSRILQPLLFPAPPTELGTSGGTSPELSSSFPSSSHRHFWRAQGSGRAPGHPGSHQGQAAGQGQGPSKDPRKGL